MTSIYSFLSKKMINGCLGKDVSEQCTKVCKEIGCHLQASPCVFIEKSNVFVKGAELSFTVPGESTLNPFLYTVPREYGGYQHFLKRLGATEQVTPRQLVNVLKAMKDQCRNEQMSSDYEEKAGIAMFLLFQLIVDDQIQARKLLSLELYLPSKKRCLIKSNELVCKVPPRLIQAVTKLNWHFLVPLDSCGLPRQRELDYFNALPENLRPMPLESLVREELDPSSKNDTCLSSRYGTVCDFIKRYLEIMVSNEFREEIVRLMKHQHKSNELTDEMMERCSRLRWVNTARVKVKCMNSIKIRLLVKETGTVVEESTMEHICHVVKENDSWTLYVHHEFGGTKIRGILSKCVNEIMDNCLDDNNMMILTEMLSCDSPKEIASILDTYDIDEDSSDGKIASTTKNLQQAVDMMKISQKTQSNEELESMSQELESMNDESGPSSKIRPYRSGCKSGSSRKRHRVISIRYFPEAVDSYTTPNRNEARRWMKQSRSDLEAAKCLRDANPPFNALVCFLSHQIVEKSLKAVLYAKRGLTDEQLQTHNVCQLANDVSSEIEGTREVAARVATYYLKTRYPNRQPDGRVPAEEFNVTEARTAVEATDKLVEIVDTFIAE